MLAGMVLRLLAEQTVQIVREVHPFAKTKLQQAMTRRLLEVNLGIHAHQGKKSTAALLGAPFTLCGEDQRRFVVQVVQVALERDQYA